MNARPTSLPGRELYDSLRKALQSESYEKVDGLLTELKKVCSSVTAGNGTLNNDAKSPIAKDELRFWLVDVGRLMFEEKSSKTKQLALHALESAVNHIRATNYLDHSAWGEMREVISKEYTSLLDTARSEKNPNWHRIWSVLVRIINRDLCQGSSIINMFLSIVEAGFRSPELLIREQSFDCWRLLVEIFANNKQINIPKRVKLICIPLKSSKSKTETIALKKFDIWWFLLCQLRSQLDTMSDTIFEPFIYFCFGPSFKAPLCYYFDTSYQELGAPGKMYQSIKQLSVIALIHLLGPSPDIAKTLLTCSDSCGTQLPFDFPVTGMAISDTLFSSKARLIIDSCIECTVLLAQMQHLDYLQINRCVWNNLISRICAETTIPKTDMLKWIKEDMNALLQLCLLHENDQVLRDMLYDTLLTITQSDLLKVNIGFDSPEQLVFNYKTIMSLLLHAQLPCPPKKSEPIVKSLFELKKHAGQNAVWDILQKTIQYLYHTDEHSFNNSSDFRSIRTQIYIHLGGYLTAQMQNDMEGCLQRQNTVMSFLLYPLEYDQLLLIESVKDLWLQVYEPIAKQETKTCEFVNAFCAMIKAMTIAKHGYSTAVVADSLCYIMQSLSVHFEPASSPVKVLELFKDVARKGLAYKSNLDRIEAMVRCFAELLEKLSVKHILILILPVRNAINELVSSEDALKMNEVRKMLKVLSNKMVTPQMSKELSNQSSDVKWNLKMLLKTTLSLPEDVKKGWKTTELVKLIKSCYDKTGNNKTPTRKTQTEEFVVIDKVWKFKPESLTEHQREKMMEKRADIPALYNDMSQSQDSFVIKPWTPSKGVAPLKQDRTNATVTDTVVDSAISHNEDNNTVSKETSETSNVQNEGTISTTKSPSESDTNRLDKENNNGNVLSDETVTTNEQQEQSDSDKEKTGKQQNRRRYASILNNLRIDTVEGKSLDVMNLSRTRRSDVSEKRSTRQKRTSSQETESEKKRHSLSRAKLEQRSASTSKIATHQSSQRKERQTSRKTLNFDKKMYSTSSSECEEKIQSHKKADVSDDVIESSQSDSSESTNRRLSIARSRTTTFTEKSKAQSEICSTTVLNNSNAVQESNVDIMTPDVTSTKRKNLDDVVPEATAVQNNDNVDVGESSEQDQREEVASNVVQKSPQLSNHENSPPYTKHESTQSGLTQKTSTIVLSPSRRSARLSLDDSSKIGIKMGILSPKKMTEKTLVAKCLYSSSKSINKLELNEKGTPSKKTNASCNNAMREALKFVGTSASHTNEEEDCGVVENHSGLSSPKVARFSPLVVLEPIKNLAKTLQDADEHHTEVVSHPVSLKMESKEQDENLSASSTQQTAKSVNHHLPLVDLSTNVVEAVGDKTKESLSEPMLSEPLVPNMDQLSPAKNLDEEMEPLNKSLNRSIVSSPNLAGEEERNADLLNNTVNISPISEEKSSAGKIVDPGELAGSAIGDRRSSNRIGGKERDNMLNTTNTPVSTVMTRRSKASPTPQTPSGSNSVFKSRTQQQSSLPHSPRTNMLGLGGRGAQLINLIRNQHNDQSPKPNTPPQNASTPKGGLGSASANRLMMRKKAIVGNATSCAAEGANAEQMMLSEENCREKSSQYLFFSKTLPSPLASPASSILKRKHNQDESGDDIESPINKRKRVSFHDPPVSLTKEYIRQAEECRPVSVSRSLQLSSNITSSADRTKFMMRRKSKSDSISELQCFTISQAHTSNVGESTTIPNRAIDEDMEEVELTSSPESLDEDEFMMHDATDNMTALQVTSDCMDLGKNDPALATQSELALGEEQQHVVVALEKSIDSSNKISFSSEEALMEHVLNRYTLDDIFERYISAGRSLEKPKSVRSLTKELSTKMSEDPKIRDVVLDELSERHSEEFLDHAIQENSNAKVCERLSAMTMIDHVFKQLHAAYNTHRPVDQAFGVAQNGKDETMRVVENIFENVLSLPSTETDGQKLADLREQLLRKELARKSRLEIMSLLENYFKTSSTL
ncbi:telomere-associated protein RIF1 [Anopheles marshallii]|uniref:telomere-associated protein RIF1 n=1 Tax=Anopheles marshallii TaxID=1521116 RepID=UPI00237C33C8|nr:telomere-associated protein RIF1 [Anopheles marshallii]